MTIVLAAAGRGRRMAELGRGTPKPLLIDPASGQPLLWHLLRRIEAAMPLRRVIVVGAAGTNDADRIADAVGNFASRASDLTVDVVLGDRRGVGYAFYIGLRRAVELGSVEVLLTVGDVVARTYEPLTTGVAGQALVVVGVTADGTVGKPDMTSVNYVVDGRMMLDDQLDDLTAADLRTGVARGIYVLRGEAISQFIAQFDAALSGKLPPHPSIANAEGEYRVTWAWQQLQRAGFGVMAADLLAVAEVNTPDDLRRFTAVLDDK